MNAEIIRLTKLWYQVVSSDHHKDRDCHWYINTVYSYGNEPIYRIEHYGYVHDNISIEFDSYESAERGLLVEIRRALVNEFSWALGVLGGNPNESDETDKERARKIIEWTRKEIEVQSMTKNEHPLSD